MPPWVSKLSKHLSNEGSLILSVELPAKLPVLRSAQPAVSAPLLDDSYLERRKGEKQGGTILNLHFSGISKLGKVIKFSPHQPWDGLSVHGC